MCPRWPRYDDHLHPVMPRDHDLEAVSSLIIQHRPTEPPSRQTTAFFCCTVNTEPGVLSFKCFSGCPPCAYTFRLLCWLFRCVSMRLTAKPILMRLPRARRLTARLNLTTIAKYDRYRSS